MGASTSSDDAVAVGAVWGEEDIKFGRGGMRERRRAVSLPKFRKVFRSK